MPFITLKIGSTMKGSRMCVIAISTPMRLWISSSGCAGSMRPSQPSMLLTTPPLCSTTTQAVVRTSSEVQNGSSTSSSSLRAVAAGAVAIQYASG